jgi:hypothetical protein
MANLSPEKVALVLLALRSQCCPGATLAASQMRVGINYYSNTTRASKPINMITKSDLERTKTRRRKCGAKAIAIESKSSTL